MARIDKECRDDKVAMYFRGVKERCVPGVECTHGGDQPHPLTARALVIAVRAPLRDVMQQLHQARVWERRRSESSNAAFASAT